MVEVEVNNRKIVVKEGWPLIEVCKSAGVEIPRFCYHESLGIAGNCRMCLVEVEKSLKPVASCAMPVASGMKIQTESMLVKQAREGVMEFLLANHPLDCPICDQGGECDLQDQAMVFGNDRGRFYEEKRAVEDKDCGPLVKTIMTRCIHCTRCVRFMSEVAGTSELGAMGRGNAVEISSYKNRLFRSEVSGNVIDLCPVGALTAKPHAFNVRPWELRTIESIDILDSMGSNISLEIRGNELLRVLPVVNDSINENWITDKVRFSGDGLVKQRLVSPMIREDNNLKGTNWETIIKTIGDLIHNKGYNLDIVVGNLVDLESTLLMKELINTIGFGNISGQRNMDNGDVDFSENYVINSSYRGMEQSDICLMVGCNIRVEMPLLAVRMRKVQREKGLMVFAVGGVSEYYFNVYMLGSSRAVMFKIIEGKHYLSSALAKASKPMVILGLEGMYLGGKSRTGTLFAHMGKYTLVTDERGWDGRNCLHLGASHVGLKELGIGNYVESPKKKSILYVLGADELEGHFEDYEYIIYQGHHGDVIAEKADMIMPGSVSVEKEGLYVNGEGRWQRSKFAVYPSGNVRTDWSIINVLLESLVEYGTRSYTTISSLRERLCAIVPNKGDLENYNTMSLVLESEKGISNYTDKKSIQKVWASNEFISVTKGEFGLGGLSNYIDNYYMTDSVSRASKVMSLCTKELL